MLDAIGDLALAGMPIQGLYRSHKGGHRLNALAVSTLLTQHGAWSIVSEPVDREFRAEARPDRAQALTAPAFAPEVL
jgi:UDP-3-O-[3-hydroxymyristoyl] N-acetylglucosamine deacetylase